MQILGFNKLTLTDYPSKIAAIVFFGGCNFRCPFCHNAVLVKNDQNHAEIDQNEIFSYLQARKNMLDGVVLSGGEPLINDYSKLRQFIIKIRQLDLSIKLDTNGTFSQTLKRLIDEKLIDYVAMDIKNSLKSYSKTTNCPVDTKNIEDSLKILKNSGIDYELRTTLVKELHTDNDLIEIGNWLKNEKNYYIQTFVNSQNLFNNNLTAFDMNHAKSLLSPYIPLIKVR